MKILDMYKLNYKEIDQDHFSVTYVGHFDENYCQVETALHQAGLRAVKRTYDKKNNKTSTVYKRTR